MSKPKVVDMPLDSIIIDNDIDPRINRDNDYIYAMMMNIGDLPPIKITNSNVLIDGAHRLIAHYKAGMLVIQAIVTNFDGTNDDLAKLAFEENINNATSFTRKERLRYAQRLYNLGVPKSKIADTVRISIATVQRWFKPQDELKKRMFKEQIELLAQKGMTINSIAKQLDVSRNKVANALKSEEDAIMEPTQELVEKAKEATERAFTGQPTMPEEFAILSPDISLNTETLNETQRIHRIKLLASKLAIALSVNSKKEIRQAIIDIGQESHDWEDKIETTKRVFIKRHNEQKNKEQEEKYNLQQKIHHLDNDSV